LLDLDTVPGGRRNVHALEHVLVADRYYRPDAVYLLTHYSRAYLRTVWTGISTEYVSSPILVDYLDRTANFKKLASLRSIADGAFGPVGDLAVPRAPFPTASLAVSPPGEPVAGQPFLALIIGLPLAWLYGIYRVLCDRAAAESERASTMALGYALLTIGYASAVTLLVSFGDFSRYRWDVDPMYLVLLVLFVVDAVTAVRRRLRRGITISITIRA
jgi:hypothetical protein